MKFVSSVLREFEIATKESTYVFSFVVFQAWKLHEQDRLLYSVDSRLVFREGEKLGMQQLISIAVLCIEYADELRGR